MTYDVREISNPDDLQVLFKHMLSTKPTAVENIPATTEGFKGTKVLTFVKNGQTLEITLRLDKPLVPFKFYTRLDDNIRLDGYVPSEWISYLSGLGKPKKITCVRDYITGLVE